MRYLLLALLTAAACSSSSSSDVPGTPTDSPDASAPSQSDASRPPSGDGGGGGDASSDASGASEDPKTDGPFTFTESDATVTGGISLHIVTPTGVAAPIPVVLIAPGYMLPPSEYLGYAKRLASHGIAGVTVGFTQSSNQKQDADNLVAALGGLPATFDASHAGVMGHSRGGKGAVLAAVQEPRFVAVLGLDPVDTVPPSFPACDPATACPDASELAKTLKIPSGFLGETLDSTGTIQACAPAADNYTTFYASAPSPSFEVTLAGANHMSFIDDPGACPPLVCTFCKTPTLAQKDALDIAYAFTAAFFLRHLRGDVGQTAFLATADLTK